jgi:hypothetical protein
MVWHLNAIHVGFRNVWMESDNLCNFGRRDILALPPECVANAVGKEEAVFLIVFYHVPSPEPCVSFAEYRIEDLLGGGIIVAIVPLEA